MNRTIDEKFELVCADVIRRIPASVACELYELNYDTFMKRLGRGGVRKLRQEKGAEATTAISAPSSTLTTGTGQAAKQGQSTPDPVTTQ